MAIVGLCLTLIIFTIKDMIFYSDFKPLNKLEKNVRAVIYSKVMPLGNKILQLEDDMGNVYVKYDYERELQTPQRNMDFIYGLLKMLPFFLFIVWLLNRKDLTKEKTKNKNKFFKQKAISLLSI